MSDHSHTKKYSVHGSVMDQHENLSIRDEIRNIEIKMEQRDKENRKKDE